MEVDLFVLIKWCSGIVASLVVVYIGLQIRTSRLDKREHLARTTALELGSATGLAEITGKLDHIHSGMDHINTTLHALDRTLTNVTLAVTKLEVKEELHHPVEKASNVPV